MASGALGKQVYVTCCSFCHAPLARILWRRGGAFAAAAAAARRWRAVLWCPALRRAVQRPTAPARSLRLAATSLRAHTLPRTLEASLTGTCSPSWLYTLGDARTCSSDLASALRIDCASPARGRVKVDVPLPASTLCKAAARHERCSHRSCDTWRTRPRSRRSRAWLSSANLVATARTFGGAGQPRGAAVLEE